MGYKKFEFTTLVSSIVSAYIMGTVQIIFAATQIDGGIGGLIRVFLLVIYVGFALFLRENNKNYLLVPLSFCSFYIILNKSYTLQFIQYILGGHLNSIDEIFAFYGEKFAGKSIYYIIASILCCLFAVLTVITFYMTLKIGIKIKSLLITMTALQVIFEILYIVTYIIEGVTYVDETMKNLAYISKAVINDLALIIPILILEIGIKPIKK